jgi:nucleotide-binding universal stress UspA family protein
MMTTYKNILVPVDFSEPSKKAVTYGLTLADQLRARLVIAHIVPESTALAYAFPTQTNEIEKDQEDKARAEIQRLLPLQYREKYAIQMIVRTGTIETELLRIVNDERADLVVMGTHGRGNPGRWLLGSVTERLLRKLPVPVLTVSHIGEEAHTIELVSLERIVYATDLFENTDAGLESAHALSYGAGAQFTVMHCVYYRDRMWWAPSAIPDFDNLRTKFLAEMRQKVDAVISRAGMPEIPIEFLVVEGKPYEKILQTASDHAAGIIVMNLQSKSTLERALIGSTAERVVRLSSIPVLSVPPAI